MAQLPSTTGGDGRIVFNDGPALHLGFKQTGVAGGPINAASQNTINAINQQAAAAKALGAGQKGSSRRRRRGRKHRGGAAQNLNANVPDIPTAGSIPGVNHVNTHINAVNNLNNARYAGMYDKLINAAPIQVKGGTRKRRGKSKRKTHGRRSKRTHRRIRH